MRTLLISLCLAVTVFQPGARADTDVIDQFLRSAEPRLVSYRARRTLEASALGGRFSASMVADTWLDANGTFQFEVIREAGSRIVRDKVLRAALDTEKQSYAEHRTDAVALTRANYDFRLRGGRANASPLLELMPKRRDRMLLEGYAVLTPSADLMRLKGSPTELPSYWTRQVTIAVDYARIHGVRVPTLLRSEADIRLAGASSFSMDYAYTAINGKLVN